MFEKVLTKSNIDINDFVILRNYQSLPKSSDGSDLDIIVKDISVIEKFLNAFTNDDFDIVNKRVSRHMQTYVFLKLNSSGRIVGLTVDFFLTVKPLNTIKVLSFSEALDNSQLYNGFRVLTHVVSREVQSVCADMNHRLNFFKMKTFFIEHSMMPARLNKLLLLTYFGFYLFTLEKFVKIFSSKHRLVFFSGLDGAGKTWVIENIEEALLEVFHGKIKKFHLLPNAIPPLGKLKFWKRKSSGSISTHEVNREEIPSNTMSFIKETWIIVRLLVGRLQLQYFFAKGYLIIFDRYYLDVFYDPLRFGIKKICYPNWIWRFIHSLYNGASGFVIDASPEEIVARKGELSLNEATELRQRLLQIYNDCDIVSNGDGKQNDTVTVVSKLVKKRLGARFE